jgi:Fur family transcriptional regulator, peroxide stress response regulator
LTNFHIRYNLNNVIDADAIRRSLAKGRLRCTPQRYAVMAFLMQQAGHPTAVEIFEAVNRVDPRSSRATIYNNLRDLVQAGLVREVAVEGRAARFDVKGLRHHHFICDRCGNVEDLDWYDVPRPATGSLRQACAARIRTDFPRTVQQVRAPARFALRILIRRKG